ncbi:SDR family NAD(P)-dependent oxidoreductase [Bacillus amyloliquefaciens]|uniref:type I polyketide synthase n=1 Tax=Bacillus amyloliquefaciens TaxID=1390 RepID=UPI0022AE7D69|nr:SDR family NAD(P)-dependent oxidoreductase [Bacillus amyloliquefaciens]
MKNFNKQITLSLKNPFIFNHDVYGQKVLPGLAYIDMFYQIFKERGYSYNGLQLRHLSIYQPLIAKEDSAVKLTVECTEVKEGRWKLTAKGAEVSGGRVQPDERIYVKAEMHETAPAVFSDTIDLDSVKREAERTIDLNELYAQCRSQELVHSGYMKAEGDVFEERDGVTFDLSLGKDAMGQAEGFLFHPTLLDGSGVGANLLISSLLNGEKRLFLPLFYESFTASEPLQAGCITRIKRSSLRQEKELIYITLEFFNASGRKVAELKDFTSKLVRDAELINTDRKPVEKSPEKAALPEVSASFEDGHPHEEAERYVKKLMAEKMGKPLEQIDSQAGYYEMGLTSSGLLDVVETISEKIGETLSPTLLFEYTTAAELAAFLTEQYGSHFSAVAPKTEKPVVTQTEKRRKSSVPQDEDIAIIGMAGRYPQAENIHEFWENLKEGKNCVTEIPESRWDWRRFENVKSPSGKTISKWGGFIDDPDCFDPQFFRITPREAETMDPQERLFLQTCWETIEDAGYTPKSLAEARGRNRRQRVGVFAGVMHKDYTLVGAEASSEDHVFPLSLNYAQIANRVSYFCNFHGPSMAVDTVCSSSLTAVHLAVESIRRGECESAIAGGVNLSLHPNKYVTYGLWDMFSSDGVCHTFGKDGDGYVPAEGIGAVLLKPLREAVNDGDRIYAVVKGSAVNHVGTVSGISVPSPVAQADLIEECLDKAGIDPRTVSYIEAHGTGTSLGDPIEVQGLVKAFRQYTQDKQFCSIGSVKSNIGHAESAAGISGLTKVALQLHHKTLVPSLHSEELNPYLDFEQSPFYVQHRTEEWHQPSVTENGSETVYPRRAGISSFGATGSNVHLILEEFIPEESHGTNAEPAEEQTFIFPVSAKNEERLQAYAAKLSAFIHPDLPLKDLAYTLQVGREQMEERVVFTAQNMTQLKERLKGFLDGDAVSGCWRNRADKGKQAGLAPDLIHKWLSSGSLEMIAEKWAGGGTMDWNLLYGENKPNRISLPTYPFEKTRYWVPEAEKRETVLQKNAGMLHPLLHENVSNMSGVRFRSAFSGGEFFLKDHVVKNERTLPGAAYLEMVRAAAEHAAETKEEGTVRLKHVVWVRPFTAADETAELYLRLYDEENGEMGFTVYGEPASSEQEPVLYAQGSASFVKADEPAKIEIDKLRESRRLIAPEACYQAYRQMGIEYGDAHKAVTEIYAQDGEVLAKLSLPSSISHTKDQFVLHPSLLDAAFHATIGLMLDKDGTDIKPMLPFALEQIDVLKRCESNMWVSIAYSGESRPEDAVQKLDIVLCDELGHVCVKMIGYSAREIETDKTDTLFFEHVWEEKTASHEKAAISFKAHHVIISDRFTDQMNSIQTDFSCNVLRDQHQSEDERFVTCALQAFEEVKKILASKSGGRELIQIVVPQEADTQLLCGLTGLLKTAALENPNLTGQLIELEPDIKADTLTRYLKECGAHPDDKHIRYENGKRYAAQWQETGLEQFGAEKPWKDNGVYLITGGAGGLGFLFAKEIARHAKNAVLILTGRSVLDNRKKAQLQELSDLGAQAVYKQTDMTDKQEVRSLTADICRQYGGLNGIIHSAGTIKDNYILKKHKDEIRDVLAPKVAGLVYLDEAVKDIELDFLILFSSGAGSAGSAGQADYAMANAFMNAFSEKRNRQKARNERYGHTLSICWPLWKDGGMTVDAETEAMLTKESGMVPMKTENGIQALYRGWAAKTSQVMVTEGYAAKIRAFLKRSADDQQETGSDTEAPAGLSSGGENMLAEKTEHFLKHVLSEVTKLPVGKIDAKAPMEDYGIDSIMIMHLTGRLEKSFGSLSKTLFFEYQNIESLAQYFMKAHRDTLLDLTGMKTEEIPDAKPSLPEKTEVKPVSNRGEGKKGFAAVRTDTRKNQQLPEREDIAIIGLSGRYPQAENLQEFWKNLSEGVDCITEIPGDRWDHSLYYDADKDKEGKTYGKWGGFLKDVDKFDPQFFSISPRDAKLMDPQERLFLQCVYETMEDAGYTRGKLTGKSGDLLGANVGVYVGVMYEEYQLYGAEEQARGKSLALTGNPSSIANRASYVFGFNGPSMALDTMCSSSLTAIHLACQSLRNGECEAAFAGGVNVSIHPNKYLMLGQNRFLSSKGRCESFGEGGDGYVPGEGVGAVLLKPLSKAKADGDHIYGLIKGTAVNHDGKTNGYSVPNPNAQAAVIKQALQDAGTDPRAVSYIEAHGTGTSLGDPIEITGLTKVFSEQTQDKQFCAIGSAKSNIGHCESAAGIAGLTKVLLQMKHRKLAPSLHSRTLNPNIDFLSTPFKVQQTLEEWKRPVINENGVNKELPRTAGLSSFGAGGVNAHIVIEEYAADEDKEPAFAAPHPSMIVLSAKNENRLQKRAKRLLDALRSGRYREADLSRIAYTLQIGREAMEERLGLIVSNLRELEEKLDEFTSGKDSIDQLYRGQVKQNKDTMALFAADEDMEKTIEAWLEKGKTAKVLELWVKGLPLNWDVLYQMGRPRKISLPAYPFAKDRYWIDTSADLPVKRQAETQPAPIVPAAVPEPVIEAAPLHEETAKEKPTNIMLQPLSGTEPKRTVLSAYRPAVSAEKISAVLTESLADVLYMDADDIDADDTFIDIGMDSITGLEWIKAVNKMYGTSLTVTKVYDYPTIRQFAAFLQQELGTEPNFEEEIDPQKTEAVKKPSNILLQPIAAQKQPVLQAKADILEAMSETAASAEPEEPIEPIEAVHAALSKALADVLYMEQHDVDIDEAFIDLGMDSITGLEWIKAVNKRYGTDCNVTKVYDYPTIRQFADFLRTQPSVRGRKKQTVPVRPKPLKQESAPQEKPSAGPDRLTVQKEPEPVRAKREPKDETADAIAIVGMSGKYPDAPDLTTYWENLVRAKNAIRDIPLSRWDVNKYYDPALNKKGKVYCRSIGMLDGIEEFDPLFFNISPSEAELMDPQHRIFLQEGFKAFEDAGYSSKELNGKNCGVYLGIMNNEYGMMLNKHQTGGSATGNSFSIAAARLPYYLNLKGPAIPIDTACSSSLVGTHLARQALLNHEIDMALVGGVTLYLTPESYISMCEAGMLSPDGQCKAFDNSANGFVPGEGAGALVLKRLKDAEADQDHIYGVIIGSGINQDGKTNGITAPSAKSQMDLERQVYEAHNIHPESITYAEMHGTGTKQGDPIELEALSSVFKEKTDRKQFCAIGSVKSNIGHTSAAAGVASVQKVLLSMKHQKLVPTLHFSTPNEHFDFNDSPLFVNTEVKPWESGETPRRACVSSFGYSGTNAHLVIEEYQPKDRGSRKPDETNIFVLSAKKAPQVKAYAEAMIDFAKANQDIHLSDMAYTLQTGRDPMDYRLAVTADSKEELISRLTDFVNGKMGEGIYEAHVKTAKKEIKAFETDDDLKQLVKSWFDKKKYDNIAELWAKGLQVDWNRLYQDEKPRRISLPAYPFAKERYWLPEPKAVSQGTEDRREAVLLEKQWVPCEIESAGGNIGKKVMILADGRTMELAEETAKYFADSFILPIDSADTGEADWNHIDGAIDLTGCGDEGLSSEGLSRLQILIDTSRRQARPLTLLYVTRGLEPFQQKTIHLAGAEKSGLYRMLQNEYQNVTSRHMDADTDTDQQTLAKQIADEYSADSTEPEVCRRNGQRYRALFREIPKREPSEHKPVTFPEDHVLFITGGTRGLGLLCARHFTEKHGVKKVVLTGREPIPPRHERSAVHTRMKEKIRAIEELEAKGVQVAVLNMKLSDRVAVAAEIETIRRTMGPIGGVIHCAGSVNSVNPAFIRKAADDIQEVLEPKVSGLQTLSSLFTNEPLQFFVLFSSVSAVVPALAAGQSDYAMANGYMDYFASAHQHQYPMVSIQWPNWKETGLGEVRTESLKQTGLLGLTNAEGLDLLDRILSENIRPAVLPAIVDRSEWHPDRLLCQKKKQKEAEAESNGQIEVKQSGSDLLLDTKEWLVKLFSDELKIAPEELETDEPFQDYGVDSIILAQLLQQMNQALKEDLDPSVLYEHPTIDAFAEWLVSNGQPLFTEKKESNTEPAVSAAVQTVHTEQKRFSGSEDIAVVGMSCRFPGAESLEQYWDLLRCGRSAIGSVPKERFGYANQYVAGLIESMNHFDSEFFFIPENDAKAMDPQALAVLEESLKLWCHAGYTREEIKGMEAGVYIGGRSQHQPDPESLANTRNPIVAGGQNYLAANVSQFFDLRGPSIVLDTACSSALTGMNMAVQALRSGDIKAAVVGGVSLLNTDAAHRMFQERGLLNEKPSFHVFDKRSGGVVLGEGVGMVLLKTVSQAQKDGDTIHAVIKAAAMNNDGRTAGPSAPNMQAQKDVMQSALLKSCKKPEDITYIEANGSGSAVTDLLELKAIQSVYRSDQHVPLGIGSIKPNIGHPLCAEGIASFIKVVLMLKHKQTVPFLSGDEPMPHFDITKSDFYFQKTAGEWDRVKPCAAINCFADGGTNAHIILEAWEEKDTRLQRKPLPVPSLRRKALVEESSVQVKQELPAKKMFWKAFN